MGLELARRLWPAEVIPLQEVALERDQALELALRLDALGHRPHAERAGHADDRRDDRRVALSVLAEVVDEGAVDLDHLDRVLAQVAERGVARAEVVEHE